MKTRHALLVAVSALFLALSADRLAPDPLPRLDLVGVGSWRDTVPTLPPRNMGRDGRPGDPLNLLIVGRAALVRRAFAAAGWTAVPRTLRGSLAAGLAELRDGRPLRSFPPMNDYWFRLRRQDMNWAIVVRPLEERHHLRLWRTGDEDPLGREVWAGSTNYDERIRWRDLSHVPDPDCDRERDFVVKTLQGTGLVARTDWAQIPGSEKEGSNDKGYAFKTDGRAAVVELKP